MRELQELTEYAREFMDKAFLITSFLYSGRGRKESKLYSQLNFYFQCKRSTNSAFTRLVVDAAFLYKLLEMGKDINAHHPPIV